VGALESVEGRGTERRFMTILGRYIFRQSIGAVLLILSSLSTVTWIGVALRQLDVMTSQGQDSLLFLKLTSLALPSLIAFIAPFAVLISCLHVINRLSGDSELIIMTASGAPTWQLVRPLLAMGLAVAAAVTIVNHAVAPWANRQIKEAALQMRTQLISQVLQPGRFMAPERNLSIHIRDRAPDGELLGLLMHDARDPAQISSYLAESGYIVKQGTSAYLLMKNGHIVRETAQGTQPDLVLFQRYAVDINRFEQKAEQSLSLRPREWTTAELLAPNVKDPGYISTPQRYSAELHDRFSNPLYPIAFVLIAAAFAGQAQTTRQNRNQALLAAFGIGVAVRVFGISAVNSANGKASAVPWMYGIPLAAIILSLIAIQWNMTPRPTPKLVRDIGAVLARLSNILAAPFRRAPKPALKGVR
jgi:lipopolysaccharide export system permease protein